MHSSKKGTKINKENGTSLNASFLILLNLNNS